MVDTPLREMGDEFLSFKNRMADYKKDIIWHSGFFFFFFFLL